MRGTLQRMIGIWKERGAFDSQYLDEFAAALSTSLPIDEALLSTHINVHISPLFPQYFFTFIFLIYVFRRCYD
jgi:hypothetical protein